MAIRWVHVLLSGVLAAGIASGCGDKDDEPSTCDEACGYFAQQCGNDTRSTCLSECAQAVPEMSQAEIDDALSCMRSAQSCSEIEACAP